MNRPRSQSFHQDAAFPFDARKQERGGKSVDTSLQFRRMKRGEPGLEVYTVMLDEKMTLVPTIQHEDVKRNTSSQLSGAAPVGGGKLVGQ